jgi:hypothetical protein
LKTLRLFVTLFALCGAAFAWPACSGQWVSVPKGTTGGIIYSTGDLTFQCQPKTPPITSAPPARSTSTSTSLADSSANSSSLSSSTSSSTANQKQNQSQGQTQTATGGDATATNNGNNSNNSTTTINEAKIPVSTAYAPSVVSLTSCFKGFSGGAQTTAFGASFGGGKIDKNCRALLTAQNAPNKLVFCKIYITLKDSKAAGVTLQDCLAATIAPPLVVIPPQPPAPLPVIVTVVLPPSPPEYRTSVDVVAPKPRSCTVTHGTVRAKVKQYKPCPTLEK